MSVLDLFTSQIIYRLALVLLTSLVLLTLASQFGQYAYLELTTHFRLHYVLASLLCAVVFLAFQSWKFVPIAVLCAVLNSVYLVPYYRASAQPKTNGSEVKLKLLLANIMSDNKNYDALAKVVNQTNADVVVLQEVSAEWTRQTKGFEQKYPHFISEPRLGGGGMVIFSRYPFDETRVLTLDESNHIAIFVRVNINGKSVSLLGLHPTTPTTRVKFINRNRQFQEAAALLRKIEGTKVLIGDLNTTVWSPYFANLVESSGLRDARLGFGLRTSWPTPLPAFLRIPIDHCLVSEDVRVEDIQIGEATGSDHRPLIVSLLIN